MRTLAYAIRRIGSRRFANPETILIEKHEASDRLLTLATRLEAADA
ncbi:hypothetical protein [Breoghania sp. L-A4]|nr:hypothetical protein [Breoghania sp. L-A4]